MAAPPLALPQHAYATTADRLSTTDEQSPLGQLEPLHRTVIMVDVAGFTARDNRTQLLIRDQVYRMLDQALTASGTNWTNWICEDRGDGVLIIVPPDVSKARLLGPFPVILTTLLREHAKRDKRYAFSLRMVIHAGDIVQDDYGHSGPAINLAARLLNAPVLRTVLARSGAPLVMATADAIYDNIVRHGYNDIDPTYYQHAKANVKGTRVSLWIHVPAQLPPLQGIPQPLPIQAATLGRLLILITVIALLFITPSGQPVEQISNRSFFHDHCVDRPPAHRTPAVDRDLITQGCPTGDMTASLPDRDGEKIFILWTADRKNRLTIIFGGSCGDNPQFVPQFVFHYVGSNFRCIYDQELKRILLNFHDARAVRNSGPARPSACVGLREQS